VTERNGCCVVKNVPRGSGVQQTKISLHGSSDCEMIALPGGSFMMGSEDADARSSDGEGPVREVTLSPFLLGKYPITNRRFNLFIQQTGYKTEAEVFGWSFVFWLHIPGERFRFIVEDTVAGAAWWCKVPGATWTSPEGPGSKIDGREEHPVVHVSWNDAQAFCHWAGMRLPSEAEWEYAARGGLKQTKYPWGNKLRPDGQHRCNIWQGTFPNEDSGDDGYIGSCPVDAFPANDFGMHSMSGNTWEWCADWWDIHHDLAAPIVDPQGPSTGSSRVIRGGSFLCHKSYCNRYRVSARTEQTPDSTTSHMGFRCAQSL